MDKICRFCGYRFVSAEEYSTFDTGMGESPYYCRDGKACIEREEIAQFNQWTVHSTFAAIDDEK